MVFLYVILHLQKNLTLIVLPERLPKTFGAKEQTPKEALFRIFPLSAEKFQPFSLLSMARIQSPA